MSLRKVRRLKRDPEQFLNTAPDPEIVYTDAATTEVFNSPTVYKKAPASESALNVKDNELVDLSPTNVNQIVHTYVNAIAPSDRYRTLLALKADFYNLNWLADHYELLPLELKKAFIDALELQLKGVN